MSTPWLALSAANLLIGVMLGWTASRRTLRGQRALPRALASSLSLVGLLGLVAFAAVGEDAPGALLGVLAVSFFSGIALGILIGSLAFLSARGAFNRRRRRTG
jgi:NAD/NADP transhydrogenase beta subunit